MLSYQTIRVPHAMHADGGATIDRRSGTRAATTLRKLPSANPGASEMRAAAAFTEFLSAPWSVALAGG
jgi:hypothetical protein